MFASETVNDITSDISGFFFSLPISSEQVTGLPTEKTKASNHRQMKKIYTYLSTAYNLISEAIHLQLFPVPGNLNGLPQAQPILVPNTDKKFHI